LSVRPQRMLWSTLSVDRNSARYWCRPQRQRNSTFGPIR